MVEEPPAFAASNAHGYADELERIDDQWITRVVRALHSASIFRGLSTAECARLAEFVEPFAFDAGTVLELFVDSVFVMLGGEVSLRTENGAELSRVRQGTIGELVALTETPHYHIMVTKRLRGFFVKPRMIRLVDKEFPGVAERLVRELSAYRRQDSGLLLSRLRGS